MAEPENDRFPTPAASRDTVDLMPRLPRPLTIVALLTAVPAGLACGSSEGSDTFTSFTTNFTNTLGDGDGDPGTTGDGDGDPGDGDPTAGEDCGDKVV